MTGGFLANTRRKNLQLSTLTKGTGANTQSLQLPKTGLLASVTLHISATVAGTLSAPNALGAASIISRVRLTLNSGLDVFNISGAGYHFLLRDTLESGYIDPNGDSTARSAVTATTFNLSMFIPVAINPRDPIGLLMLQNEQTIATLSVDFLADASVATGATVTCTVTPYIEIFTVPLDFADFPPLNILHQILEDQQAVSAAGAFAYPWPRGNQYMKVLHGLGVGASGSDLFSRTQIVVNQSDYLMDVDNNYLDREFRRFRGRARPSGTIPIDYAASSGLGMFGSSRDFFNSAEVTDIKTQLTATGAGTLITVREQLVALGG